MCDFMLLATLQLETKLQNCIRMGITIFKTLSGEVYGLLYVRKSHFTVLLTSHCKTKFPTVCPMIYLPKWKFWVQLSPKWMLHKTWGWDTVTECCAVWLRMTRFLCHSIVFYRRQKVSQYHTASHTWVKVFRNNPEFRILRLTFHLKSASKC